MTGKLHIGLRLDAMPFEDWQRVCITRIRELPGVVITSAISDTDQDPAPGGEHTDLDVIVDLGSRPPDPDLAARARHGLWAFRHGEEGRRADCAVPELVRGARACVVRLVRFGPEPDAAMILEEGAFKTVPHSPVATRARVFGGIADWPVRQLRRLRGAEPPLPAEPFAPKEELQDRHGRLILPLILARNLARRIADESVREQWTIGIIDRPVEHVVEDFDPRRIRWLPELSDGYLADPFGHRADGRLTVLAEAYRFDERHGHIVALDPDAPGDPERPRTVLRLPVHCSYPQILQHEGGVYMLPETCAAGRVQLFRADPFPEVWRPDAVLLDGFAGADATIVQHAGRFWMFATDHGEQDQTALHLFHAPNLMGPWTPHPLNPVKSDLRSARPGGPLFVHNGDLYRPAQDCSETYGGAIALNRIDRLTEDDFVERTVRYLRPDPDGPYPAGLHTLVGVGDITLVDGKRHVRSGAQLAAGLGRMWRELRGRA